MGQYKYNGKFGGNIPIVGRTAYRKTFFVQKLAINIFFGKIKNVEWVSYISLDKNRKGEIQSCFFLCVMLNFIILKSLFHLTTC